MYNLQKIFDFLGPGSKCVDIMSCPGYGPVGTGMSNLSRYYQILDRFVLNTMDELPSRSQPVNPSHVTLNGLSHYYPHNASVNNSI